MVTPKMSLESEMQAIYSLQITDTINNNDDNNKKFKKRAILWI